LYYSPPLDTPVDDPSTPEVNEGDAPFEGTEADWARFRGVLRLSRFKLVGDELDLGTEQQIIDVPVDRGICCHVGGQIDFDGHGNLFLSTGDDTNPFFSDGYAPLDDRPGRNPAFDARRSAGNTNDLRGKLLRIRVKGGGGYTVPRGNLFRPGTPRIRPEIYAMGLRNPFRFSVNRTNGDVYMADYSPDAPEPNPLRGPAGHGRWMLIREPGNYGWPYCVTLDMPYIEYDFATGESGEPFDCLRPVNDSALNTGQRVLPPLVQPDVWYTYQDTGEFPELFQNMGGDGIGPMAGPAYQYDAKSRSRFKWPRYYRCSTSGPATTSRSSDSTAPTAPGWRRSGTSRCSSTTRWTWSSALTARFMCSSMGTGSSRRTRTPSSRGSTLCAATTHQYPR
jgi:hypothetical protein